MHKKLPESLAEAISGEILAGFCNGLTEKNSEEIQEVVAVCLSTWI